MDKRHPHRSPGVFPLEDVTGWIRAYDVYRPLGPSPEGALNRIGQYCLRNLVNRLHEDR